MVKFSEKIVQIVSLVIFIALLFAGWKQHWIWIFEIIPLMIYFSTKGVLMFEDKLWWGTRLFWALSFSACLFYFLYRQLPTTIVITKEILLTRVLIALCMGSWFGDFFAKYIYIRLRFCINRIGAKNLHGPFAVLKTKDYSQQYLKSPFKKMKLSFYYVDLRVEGEEISFLTNPESLAYFEGKSTVDLIVKKGILGYHYVTSYPDSL